MSATAITTGNWVELADRAGDGLDVRLYWNSANGRVKVTVMHLATERVAQLDVAPADALEAFHHPFAYAAARGLCFGEAARDSLDLQPQS